MNISTNCNIIAEELKRGGVVAVPTETVYGLGANIFNEDAIREIFNLKKRPLTNPLIVHIGNLNQLDTLVDNVPDCFQILIKTFWPGPLTILMDKKDSVPNIVTANSEKVAIRMPNHPLFLKVLTKLDFPIAAPSANPYKRISSTEIEHVKKYFDGQLKYALDGGKCTVGIESTIVGLEEGEVFIYRKGGVSKEQLENVLDKKVFYKEVVGKQLPGSALKHYSPLKEMILSDDINKTVLQNSSRKIGILQFSDHLLFNNIEFNFSFKKNLEYASKNLFNYLHFLEQQEIDLIICEKFPSNGIGNALNDRIYRASSK